MGLLASGGGGVPKILDLGGELEAGESSSTVLGTAAGGEGGGGGVSGDGCGTVARSDNGVMTFTSEDTTGRPGTREGMPGLTGSPLPLPLPLPLTWVLRTPGRTSLTTRPLSLLRVNTRDGIEAVLLDRKRDCWAFG